MNERHLNFRIISRHAQHHLVRHFLCALRNERRKVYVFSSFTRKRIQNDV